MKDGNFNPYPKPEPRPKKLPQPLKRTPLPPSKKPIKQVSDKRQAEIDGGLFRLKVGKPLKRITAKQSKIEAEKSKVYRLRSEGERPFCFGCERYDVPLSNSHRIGQARKEYVCNPDNIDTLCIGEDSCHSKYECGYLFQLANGNEILTWLAATDWQKYASKVYQVLDRINDLELSLCDLPDWVEQHVFNVTK